MLVGKPRIEEYSNSHLLKYDSNKFPVCNIDKYSIFGFNCIEKFCKEKLQTITNEYFNSQISNS